MEQKERLLQELEARMEQMDTQGVDQLLEQLAALDTPTIAAEDPMLFAARVKKLDKEHNKMNTKNKKFRIAIVAAALAATLSVGVYASGIWSQFRFEKDDKLVTVKSTTSLSAKDAQGLADETVNATKDTPASDGTNVGVAEATEAGANVYTPEYVDYDSAEQASKATGVPLPLPTAGMEKFTFESASATDPETDTSFGQTVWLNYTAEDDKMVGVTVIYTPPTDDVTIITEVDMDAGSAGTYKAKNGTTFKTHKEEGAQIAVAEVGNYEYALVTFGLSDQEWQAMADSIDLSAYK